MNQRLKTLLSVLAVFAVASALCLTLYQQDNKYTAAGAQPLAGTLFVSEADWIQTPRRYLWNGWSFYPDALLTPETYESRRVDQALSVQIGAYNNLAFGNPNRSPHGCGTYVLTLLLPDTPHTYAIELPEIYSAYHFYVGDTLALSMGNPSEDGYAESLQNRMVTFEGSGTVRLLLAVRDEGGVYSGMVYPPAFGELVRVNTSRGVRICLSMAAVAVTLLFAALALFIAVRSNRKGVNAGLFCLLCLSTAVFFSYPVIHSMIPMPVQPWHTVELVNSHFLTLLILLLHNRVCGAPRPSKIGSTVLTSALCLTVLGYGVFAARLTQPMVQAFSALEFCLKLAVTAYLLLTAVFLSQKWEKKATPIFYADLFYAAVFLWSCLLPAYEPILGVWFQEWGCIILVVTLGAILWLDVAQGYRASLTFAEEQRQMRRHLEMQQLHYRQIAQQVEVSRRQRHDFRQHLRTIAGLADNPEAQIDYIQQIAAVNEVTRLESYCADPAVDALLYYYVTAAKVQKIAVTVKVELPEGMALPTVPLCTILGNLLENAEEACQRQTGGERFIRLHMKWQFSRLYLVVENSFDGEIRRRLGGFLSSKHEGLGMGTKSVQTIAAQLGGTAEFRPGDGLFQAILILNPGAGATDSSAPPRKMALSGDA